MKLKYRLTLIFLLGFATIAYAKSTKFSYIHTNFTAGELSPKMDGRVDFPKYFNGGQTLDNFIIYPQGGVARRSGFEYINTAKTSNEQVRLIPFEFSTTQAYIIEMGDLYMRFYMNGGRITGVDAYTKLLLHCDGNDGSVVFTDSGATVHTVTAVDNAQIDIAQSKFGGASGVFDGTGDYLTIPDHADWDFDSGDLTIDFWVRYDDVTTGAGHGLFGQVIDTDNRVTCYNTYTFSQFRLWFTAKEAAGIDIGLGYLWSTVQNDTWYHIAIVRDGNTFTLYIDGVAKDTDTDASDCPDLATAWLVGRGGVVGTDHEGYIDEFRVSKGIARWTANFTPPSIEYPQSQETTPYELATPYLSEYLPTIKYVQSADTMWLVHEDYKPRKLTRTGHTAWSIDSYAPVADPFISTSNHPAAVAFFEERLCFGGTVTTPQGLWLSVSGDFEDMTTGANADDAMAVEIAADQVNTIRWLEPGRVLVVGTVGGEWKIGASSLDDPITPTNITVRRETAYGSANVQPETIGKNVLFVQRAGKKIREFGYNFDVDGYISHDLSILADHIVDSPIIDMAYQQEPYSILWCVTEDGTLLSLTYQKDHEVVAWSEHPVGGTDAEVKSVAVIPGDEEDEVWISVERTISGVSSNRVNYIERMKSLFSGTDTTDAFFVDSGLSYEGGAVTSVSGLDHLEGVTVVALADGIPLTAATATTPADLDLTVASGAITLGTSVSTLHAGFAYNSNIETLRIAVPSESSGTIQGKTKRISNVTLRLLESLECKIGPDSSNLVSMDFTDGNTAFSGDKNIPFDDKYNKEGYIYIRQDAPLPLTVLAIIPEVRVSD